MEGARLIDFDKKCHEGTLYFTKGLYYNMRKSSYKITTIINKSDYTIGAGLLKSDLSDVEIWVQQ